MADDTTDQGPLGSPGGQLLQRGMNFLFGQQPKKGMVAPVATVKPVAPVTAPAPAQTPPQIAPTIDLKSPNNVMTYVDSIS